MLSLMISSILGTSSASKPSTESFSRDEILIMVARLTPLSRFNLSIFFFNPTIFIKHYLCPKNTKKLIEQLLTLHDLHKRSTPNDIADGLQNSNCLPPQTRRTGLVILSIQPFVLNKACHVDDIPIIYMNINSWTSEMKVDNSFVNYFLVFSYDLILFKLTLTYPYLQDRHLFVKFQ